MRRRISGGGGGGGVALERGVAIAVAVAVVAVAVVAVVVEMVSEVARLVVVVGDRAMTTATVAVDGTGNNQPNLD